MLAADRLNIKWVGSSCLKQPQFSTPKYFQMKHRVLLMLVCFIAFSACAQNEKTFNDANAQSRSVGSFHAIRIEDGIDLYLTQGNEEAVAVSASKDEYRDKITTKVENGVLFVYYGEERGFNITWRDRKLRAYISVRDIDEIKASSGSDVILKGTLTAKKLMLDLSGGSDFVGDVKSTELEIEMSGGSDVNISGSANNLKVNGSGGSDFNGYKLAAEYVIIQVSGGSDAQLNVTKELFAEASGGSDIDYRGSPEIKRKSSSGGSSVTKRG